MSLCHILQCGVDKPFVSARDWVYGTRSICLVDISTDESVTRWGERYTNHMDRSQMDLSSGKIPREGSKAVHT